MSSQSHFTRPASTQPAPQQRNYTRRAALAAGAAGVVLALSACAGSGTGAGASSGPDPIKKLSIIVPANPGGGWDQTGRAIQADLQSNKLVSSAQVTNIGGGGGTNGLAKLATEKDANTLMVMGYVMVGAVETNAAKTRLEDTTPIARLTEEPLVVVVPASSKYQSVADLVADIKANGKGVAITGGSAGGADHILAGQILKSQGVEADKLNYIGYSGGGESIAALLGNKVQAGISGVGEYAEQVKAGKVRALAVSGKSEAPALPGVKPLKDQGIDVVLTNWRGVVAPGSIDDAQRAKLTDVVTKLHDSEAWKSTLAKNNWDDAFLSGDSFKAFLTEDIAKVKTTLTQIGLVK
ncbi:tripartite tricarboxylate transporter substrate binding protein [Arthrobacter sp. PM3]|uniref:Bug family tripartite tricarboxylate transporter substrate binding protein n=1 Tax=Arthrobacter sp. PM3 TaxID=2017685 RepID=UPI000E109838|nr:tripartite tricarboxylate transporter substrate-binding protein [Arthrobacter sp. PM3]AXJ10563.1 C4-dicarboxylate ABC transporter substrate-binding protein [Arthrobacter sp. PM3]